MTPFKTEIQKILKRKIHPNQTVVWIEEEFGYRLWIWIANMNWKKLEQWWQSQERMGKFELCRFFENGEMIEVYPSRNYNNLSKLEDKVYFGFVFDDVDSCLVSPNWNGNRIITHRYYEEANRILDQELKENEDGNV